MTKSIAEVPLREITGVIAELQDTAIYAWRRQAQKVGIIGWRDSTRYPGALARFEMAAYSAASYHFAHRKGKARYSAGAASMDQRPYVHTTALRSSIAGRKPVSKNAARGSGGYQGGDVVTTISIDGAALNALTNKYGFTASRRETHPIIVQQPSYTRPGKHGLVKVRGSSQHRIKKTTVYTPAAQSYRDEFQLREADLADMRRRDELAFREIVRSASFTKSGKLKVSVIAKFTTVEAAP